MDFSAQIKTLAERIPGMLGSIQTEEATKQYLILPFIQAIGYNIFDTQEVVPEFDANVGAAKKYKLDYALFKDGKPIILIECKSSGDKLAKDDAYSQLFHYFAAVDARIGILTNGIIYKFYADLDKQHVMDNLPFLEIDMLDLKDPLVEELKRITKSVFDIDEMVSAATELKYIGGILGILAEQLNSPSEDFTKVFFSRLCPGKVFSPSAKTQFAEYTQRALKQFVREQISSILDASGFIGSVKTSTPVDETTRDDSAAVADVASSTNSEPKIVTTAEELEGYYIVKSILRGSIELSRITYRDVQSYFGILLDDNNRRPICRLYLNSKTSMKLGLFDHGDDEKQEEKVPIESLDDIYKFSEKLKATALHYDSSKKAE